MPKSCQVIERMVIFYQISAEVPDTDISRQLAQQITRKTHKIYTPNWMKLLPNLWQLRTIENYRNMVVSAPADSACVANCPEGLGVGRFSSCPSWPSTKWIQMKVFDWSDLWWRCSVKTGEKYLQSCQFSCRPTAKTSGMSKCAAWKMNSWDKKPMFVQSFASQNIEKLVQNIENWGKYCKIL